MPWLDPALRSRCPCCGYLTLEARGEYDICRICWWEDDGQDEANAEVARGGPNHGYSLAEARRNFREFGVMYEPEGDRRISGPDNDRTRSAKLALRAALELLEGVTGDEARRPVLADIRKQERVLADEVKRGIKEYEARCRSSRTLEGA